MLVYGRPRNLQVQTFFYIYNVYVSGGPLDPTSYNILYMMHKQYVLISLMVVHLIPQDGTFSSWCTYCILGSKLGWWYLIKLSER